MALVLKDRVKETSTSTGTGSFVLSGAVDGFQSFASALADGDTTYYAIEDGTDWETGLGTWTEATSTLARTTVYESSNSGNAVDWGAGSKNVFITQPASRVATINVYPTIDDLPLSGNVQAGDQAYVSGNNRLYLFNGSGWYNIALINQTPTVTGNEATYALATDGTPTEVTLTGTDPEGIPITWSATTSGDTNAATVTNVDNVFTITPSTDTADQGIISVTFRASDGVNIGTASSEFTLAFVSALWPNVTISVGTSSTNGLGNSTFIDRSTNAHTVTPSGSPVQTAFHPYLDNWSLEIPSGTNYVTMPTNAAYAISDAFTIECWVNAQVTGSIISTSQPDSSTDYWTLNILSDGKLNANFRNGPTPVSTAGSSTVLLNGQWHHVAVVRQAGSTTVTLYVDGQSEATFTWATGLTQDPVSFGAFRYPGFESYSFVGNISNARISDVARYTSNFTPSAGNFTSDSNTKLLAFQDNRFIDRSSVGNSFTLTGSPKISAFNPFGQGSEYASGENKGSIFSSDGGDYLAVPQIDLGAGDFTIECWHYSRSRVNTRNGIWSNYSSYTAGALGLFAGHTSATVTAYQVAYNGGTFPAAGLQGGTIAYNQWNHIAVVRNSGTMHLYINGTSVASKSLTADLSGVGSNFYINTPGDNLGSGIDGYIADFNITTGTAVYTSAFTPPTAPVGNSGKDIYIPMDNAGIYDKTGINNLTLNGDVATSTTQTKFADTAMYFDGSGDYLLTDFPKLGTGDFTIEFWINPSTINSDFKALIDTRTSSVNNPLVWIRSNNVIYYFTNGAEAIVGTTTLSQNTWYHVALSRSGGITKLFLNGNQEGSNYTDATSYTESTVFIGQRYTGTAYNYHGYIENLQILKGVAKYTTNFTPPTAEQGRLNQAES